jgi:hypothetical protein
MFSHILKKSSANSSPSGRNQFNQGGLDKAKHLVSANIDMKKDFHHFQ